ncbi:MAG: peroxiredoxin [Anaerolineae bacterium]|nr:peroxiredoxin [Anaerolineae bacterium]
MPTIGDQAPDFEMLTDEGKPAKLSDYRGKKVVLYFYPKDFTSGCEFQACKFRDNIEAITSNNAVVLGVSADDVDSHAKFREALKLPFTLLVDPESKYAKQWGAYGSKQRSDGTSFEGIIRSQYVIDENGNFTDVQTPVDYRQSIDLALAAIQPTSVK